MTWSDRDYVLNKLLPEFRSLFEKWNAEYQQPRDLGARAEFVGLYRKARKLKTALWDSPTPPEDWREDVRTIAMEIAGHAFLLVMDLDELSMNSLVGEENDPPEDDEDDDPEYSAKLARAAERRAASIKMQRIIHGS